MKVLRVLSQSLRVGLVETDNMVETNLACGLFVHVLPGTHGAPHTKGQGFVRDPGLSPAPTGSPGWPTAGQANPMPGVMLEA